MLVQDKQHLADGVVGLTLVRADAGPMPRWTPGAHIDVELAPGVVRQYSLCGDPADARRWQIAVLREPNGTGGSQRVHDEVQVGATLDIGEPRNDFPLVDARRYLFVAGGIGVTPLLPMLRAVAASKPWQFVYGGRRHRSMAFLNELRELGDHVHILPEDTHGKLPLDQLLADAREDTAVYCCGPEPLLRAVEDRCADRTDGSLHIERFATPEPRAGDKPFEVELKRSGTTLRVPPDRTVLEVLEEAGVDVLSSCRTGTCGTCEMDVVAGTPDHRDTVLTAAEKEEGTVMMACTSRALSDRIVLDA